MTAEEMRVLVATYEGLRDRRLVLDRESKKVKEQEDKAKEQLLTTLRSVGGRLEYSDMALSAEKKDKPTCEDWGKTWAYIVENQAFDLVQKRLTETAVKLRWEDGIDIPGIIKFPVYELHITRS